MTPSLDSCLNSIYEPGFIPADPGLPPSVPIFPFDIVGACAGIGTCSGVNGTIGFSTGVGAASGVGGMTGLTEEAFTGNQFLFGAQQPIMLNVTSDARTAIAIDSFIQGF